MTLKNDTLNYDISAPIVDTSIGDMFFRDEEVLANVDSDSDADVANAIAEKAAKQANEKTNALNLFVKNEPRVDRHVDQADNDRHPARQGPYQDGQTDRHERHDRWPARPRPGRRLSAGHFGHDGRRVRVGLLARIRRKHPPLAVVLRCSRADLLQGPILQHQPGRFPDV